MGNSQYTCTQQNINPSILQIPKSFNQGLQINLKNYFQHIPASSYARKASVMPNLPQKVQKTLSQIIKISPLKYENFQGYQFPMFYLLKKKVFYLGEWLQGLPNGKGKVYFQNGSLFQGWFNKGQAEGVDNIFIYPDGSFYRGGFKNSVKNGYGQLFFHSGFQYQGTWKNGVPHGQNCRQRYPDNSTYIGDFNDGVKQGQGIYIWPNQIKYTGQFINGYMEGYGILQKESQSYFQGQFIQNMKQGQGKLKLKYGTYQGLFQNGLMNGQGKFIWNDGRIYTGNFLNGKIHGKGQIKFKNGNKIIGQWINGENTTSYRIVQK